MKLSVFMPTIRTHLHQVWYDSLEASCNRHDFEVVMCGPFQPPDSILSKTNVTWIKSFASPTVCAQLALLQCKGDYVFHTVDDSLFIPNVISNELDNIENNTIVGMRYREGQSHSGNVLPDMYWYASNAYPRWNGVDPSWGICVHFLMSIGLCGEVGGFDCKYDYLNHATHDLLFRLQKRDHVSYRISKSEISSADWQPNITGDHAPIHNAQIGHDEPIFASDWQTPNNRGVIDLMNYESYPEVWKTRFTGKEQDYEGLGYK
jgi:hypothetical protein